MKIWDKHFVALQIFVATNIQLHVFSQGDLVAAISWWMGMSMYVTSWCDVVLSYTEAFKARFPACRHACMFLPRTLTLTDMILMIRWALNLQWLRTGPRHTAMRSATGLFRPARHVWFGSMVWALLLWFAVAWRKARTHLEIAIWHACHMLTWHVTWPDMWNAFVIWQSCCHYGCLPCAVPCQYGNLTVSSWCHDVNVKCWRLGGLVKCANVPVKEKQ